MYYCARCVNSPSYGYSRSYNDPNYHTTPGSSSALTHTSNYVSTYSGTYNAPKTERTSRSRISRSPASYTPPTVGCTSKTQFRSPSRKRDTYEHISSGSTPIDTAGRPLPKGPGTRDHRGRLIDHKEHLATLQSTLRRSSSTSHKVRHPVRADHSYATPSSHLTPSRGSLVHSKHASSVVDLTQKYEDLSLTTCRTYGSTVDLSDLTSTHKLDRLSDCSATPRRASYLRDDASPLPDINITNKTSQSPLLDDKISSRFRSIDDFISPRTSNDINLNRNKSTHESNQTETNDEMGNYTSDYNNNKKGVVGLRNIGNTCFMNSVLQCLSNTKPLLEYCLEDQYKKDLNNTTSKMKGELIKVYAAVMKSVWKGNEDLYVTPSEFKNQIAKFAKRFVGYYQQDAQEFLSYLLHGIHEDVNRAQKKKPWVKFDSHEVEQLSPSQKAMICWNTYLDCDNSIIVDLFVGQLRSALTCTVCNNESNTFDPFLDLSLPIPKNKSSVSLLDCFSLFTLEETLDGDEKAACARCKRKQRSKKRFYIQKFPKVLIIHLKRFNQVSQHHSKLSTRVDFPVEELKLEAYAAPRSASTKYSLYAVCNHSGSISSGHYTTYAKNPYTGKWHYFNDQRVCEASVSQLQSAEAYILFYQMVEKGL